MLRRIILLLTFLLTLSIQAQARLPSSVIMRHQEEFSGVNWSADGNKIFSWSASWNGNLRLWDLEAGTYNTIERFWYDVGIDNVIWSPDETRYAVELGNRSDASPFNFDVAVDGQVLARDNNRAVWNPDSRRIVTWLDDMLYTEDEQPLRVYDTESRELIGSLSHFYRVQEAVWSSDAESVLYLAYHLNDSAFYGQYVVGRWIPTEREPVEEIALPEKDGYWVSWRPGDTLRDTLIIAYPMYGYQMPDCEIEYCLLSIKFAGQAEFVDFTGDELEGVPMDIELSPSGNQLIAINIDYEGENCRDYCSMVSLWNQEAPNEPILLDMQTAMTGTIVWSPDESRFLVWYSDDELDNCENDVCTATLKLINSAGETELLIPQTNEFLESLQWNQAGDGFIFASNYDGDCEEDCFAELKLIDAETGESRLNLVYENTRIYQVEWREETNQLAVAAGRFIYIYDLAAPENPLILEGHSNINGWISFIWRDDELLSWSVDATLRYWDLSGETEPYEMGDWLYQIEEVPEAGYTVYRFHRNGVHSLELNADESRLLSWSWDDATLAVWDINGDTEPILLTHFPRTGYVRLDDARWVDNSHFLTSSSYGIQVWDIGPNGSFFEPEEISYDEYRIRFQGLRYLPVDTEYDSGLILYEPVIEGLPEIRIEHGGSSRVRGYFFEQHDWFMSRNNDSTKLWDIADASNPVLLAELPYSITDGNNWFILSPDERFLVWQEESLHVLELPSLEEVYSNELLANSFSYLQWDNAGERLFLSINEQDCEPCRYELLVLYPFEERQPLVISHARNITFFHYFASEDVLISVEEGEESFTHTMRIWDSQTGAELRQFSFDMELADIRLEQGKLLILPFGGNRIYVFDGILDEHPLILEHERSITRLLLSSDGQKLIVGQGSFSYPYGVDGDIRVWDLPFLQKTARN